jgi:membrane-associated phospholipid phosphatase
LRVPKQIAVLETGEEFRRHWRRGPLCALKLVWFSSITHFRQPQDVTMSRAFYKIAGVIVSAACTIEPVSLAAQSVKPQTGIEQSSVSTDTTHKAGKPLFTKDDAFMALGFAGLTVLMFPADKSLANRLRSPSSSENQFIARATTGVEFLADPGSIVIGSAAYLLGRVTHHLGLEDAGLHGTESILVASSITWIAKGAAGRARPYLSNGTDPRNFRFGKGFGNGDRQSFPSGHTTAAFAAAASVTSEVKRQYPKYAWVAGPVMYGGATLVGLSRMYHNKHWASDVVLGAAVGTFSGLKIVRYSHNNPDNPFDKRLLKAMVQPNGQGGELVGVSLPIDFGGR